MTRTITTRFPVDDAELTALHAAAFGAPPGPPVPWRRRLAEHALTWVGAFEDERLIGFVQVCWDGGEHAFLLDTAVAAEHRHEGIGTALVRAAVAEAAEAGCAWLHVDYEEHLTAFYTDGCGFTPTAAGLLRLDAASA
jgi:GNAT superfamily N-acetyltransferase